MYRCTNFKTFTKIIHQEFSLWPIGSESDRYPRGCRFDPWPRLEHWESGVAVSCGVGCRCGSDPALLWLWRRPAATALIWPLAWEPPYAAGAAQENGKKTTTKKTKI